jgi:hypothetical protein
MESHMLRTDPTTYGPATPPASTAWRGGAAALVVSAVLLVVSTALQPDLGSSTAQKLAALDAGGLRVAVSSAAFVLAQLPMVAALIAIGRLLRPVAPRIATAGVAIGVAGAFGESVTGGISLTWISMAHDTTHRATYADLMQQMNSQPVMLFALMGLLGSVVGLLTLSIGIFRTGVAPRWIGPALWAFLVLEYVGSAITPILGYVAVLLGAAAFVGLARQVDRD